MAKQMTTQLNAGTSVSQQQQQVSVVGSLTPVVLLVLVFYFIIMRPQQKREAKRRDLINSVKRGDRVLMSSGIIGTVHKVIGDKEISLEISENVRVRMMRATITELLDHGSAHEAAQESIGSNVDVKDERISVEEEGGKKMSGEMHVSVAETKVAVSAKDAIRPVLLNRKRGRTPKG
ncbi:MAG: preprotein translocase subunit YajC [Holosporaceae bacterium]|jgi:preprotein translocase subunit YajC|nr:preprotein translocase subunit YajC [Holosporaceae bacterium]